jgi:hypothetical protein
MLTWSAVAALVLSALVVGPFSDRVPALGYEIAWLTGACALFALICHYESSSGS